MVVVRWINGQEDDVGDCTQIMEARAKVCKSHGILWPYVSLFTTEFEILANDEAEPPAIVVVVYKDDTDHAVDEWINAALMHAIYEDPENVLRLRTQIQSQNINHAHVFQIMWQRYWTRKPQGSRGIVEVMRKIGIDVDTRISEMQNSTALHIASSHGTVPVVEALLESGADIDLRNGPHLETSLQVAVQCGKCKIVSTLLSAKAQVNISNGIGEIALHKSAANGNLRTVEQLLEAKSELNVKTKNGYSALHHALYNGFLPGVRALINAGANIDYRAVQIANGRDVDVHSVRGKTKAVRLTIRWAQSDNRHKEICDLIESRALPNLVPDEEESRDNKKKKKTQDKTINPTTTRPNTARVPITRPAEPAQADVVPLARPAGEPAVPAVDLEARLAVILQARRAPVARPGGGPPQAPVVPPLALGRLRRRALRDLVGPRPLQWAAWVNEHRGRFPHRREGEND